MPLTWKQRLFVNNYLENGGNATDAARKAGYGKPPEVIGCKLLRVAKVRAAIDAGMKGVAMPALEVLARLSEIASSGLDPFIEVDEKGIWRLDVKKAKRRGSAWMIKKIKSTEDGPEIEGYSVLDALDKLAKVHGLFQSQQTEEVEQLKAEIVALREEVNNMTNNG